MARIRTIKPEFWSDEKVVECSLPARLLFIGLWNFADDAGRQEDAPRQIKMKVYPGDDITAAEIEGMLRELAGNGLIIRYVADGKGFIQIKGWRHQVINKPQKSKIPPCPETHSGSATVELPVGMEGKGKERKGEESSPPTPSSGAPDQDRKEDEDDRLNAEADWKGIEDEIWSMANLRPDAHRAAGKVDDFRIVRSWREKGFTAEEVRQACKAVIERAGEIRSLWGLLAKTVPEQIEKIRSERATASPGVRPEDALEIHRSHMRLFTGPKRIWMGSWGAGPDEPGCLVPSEILAEFGFGGVR